jgi:broad specificity phosphatase PhoE
MKLYLVRHARSYANQMGLLTGLIDDSLSEEGCNQAIELRDWLNKFDIKIDKYVTSQWKRANQTAHFLYPSSDWIVDSRLGETNAGDSANIRLDRFLEEIPNFYLNPNNKYPNGESHNDLNLRVMSWLSDLLDENCQQVLVVAHAGPICCVLQKILGIPMDLFPKLVPANASLTLVELCKFKGEIKGDLLFYSRTPEIRDLKEIKEALRHA